MKKPSAPPPAEPPKAAKKKLWPIRLPVVGVTGQMYTGKTHFLLDIARGKIPWKKVVAFDFELGMATYLDGHEDESSPYHGITYFNVWEELGKIDGGDAPDALWVWFRNKVKALAATGKYDLILIDTAGEVEESLEAYIAKNPGKFNLTAEQIAKTALKWVAHSREWTRLLASTAGKIQTLAYSVHLRTKYVGGKPTTQSEPTGKKSLFKLTSLFLWLEPAKDSRVPNAKVLKDRIETRTDPPRHCLPTFIKKCTPNRIRFYMENPVGLKKTATDQAAEKEQKLSKEEMTMLAETAKLETAQAKARAAELQVEAEKSKARLLKKQNKKSGLNPDATRDDDPVIVKESAICKQLYQKHSQHGGTKSEWVKLCKKHGGEKGTSSSVPPENYRKFLMAAATLIGPKEVESLKEFFAGNPSDHPF